MTPRQHAILEATTREYIRDGEPVGSAALCDHARLPWSSATVRAEFAELERAGFLSHLHESAGRIPTTAGYRYYVDHTVERVASPRAAARFERVDRRGSETADLVRELAEALARLSGVLAVVAVADTVPAENAADGGAGTPRRLEHVADVYEAGFRQLFRLREFDEHVAIEEVGAVLDAFHDWRPASSFLTSAGPTVFIDGETPFARVRRVSMVLASPTLPSGIVLFSALVGPTRMPYNRHLGIMQALHETFQAPPHD